eukprot:gnl/MRDRNA2_/MRDRNA2_282807_c0_seq1.p1 gnl/MRDRNA2_/MRDRNA2_282807_c0~~gnl/MRDRNA2_/MRDRNA2_282807_c0_seq1.p1  ORF type:complete len:110 (-),score=8.96 gnl/MRDRNA2_/MRDRNA2_282807_c0_seq1:31-360(-)
MRSKMTREKVQCHPLVQALTAALKVMACGGSIILGDQRRLRAATHSLAFSQALILAFLATRSHDRFLTSSPNTKSRAFHQKRALSHAQIAAPTPQASILWDSELADCST